MSVPADWTASPDDAVSDFPQTGSAPVLAGDYGDDDGPVIDSLVEQHAEPPAPSALPQGPAQRLDTVKIPVPNRLITGTVAADKAWTEPTLFLPADPNRIHLVLRAMSATATDTVLVSDDTGKVQAVAGTVTGGGLTLLANVPITLDDYTGPLWVKGHPNNTGPAYLTYVAVTK